MTVPFPHQLHGAPTTTCLAPIRRNLLPICNSRNWRKVSKVLVILEGHITAEPDFHSSFHMTLSASQMWLRPWLEMQSEHTFVSEPCNRPTCKPKCWPTDIRINVRMHLCHIQISITYGCQMVQYHSLHLPPNVNSCCFSCFWSAHHAATSWINFLTWQKCWCICFQSDQRVHLTHLLTAGSLDLI